MPGEPHKVAKIPLETALDGTLSQPAIEFSPAGDLAYVSQQIEAPSILELVRWYGPNFAVPLIPVLAIIALWLIVRIHRRPQIRGKVYCRSCNYMLVPPLIARDAELTITTSPGARCPECGVDLAIRRPQSGRRRALRLWPLWLVIVPGLALCAGLSIWGLEWRSTGVAMPFGLNKTWPIPGLERYMGSWAVQRQRDVAFGSNDTLRLTRWRMPSAEFLGEITRLEDVYQNSLGLTSDGSRFVTIPHRTGELLLICIDAHTGKRSTIKLDRQGYGTVVIGTGQLVGDINPASDLYVRVQHPSVGSRNPTFIDELLRINLNTLETVSVAKVQCDVLDFNGSRENPYTTFCVDVGSPSAPGRWVHTTFIIDINRVPIRALVTAGSLASDERRTHTVELSTYGASSIYPPRLVDAGRAFELVLSPSTTLPRIDLATGAVTSVPATANLPVRARSGRLEAHIPGGYQAVATARLPTPIQIIDVRTNTPLTSFSIDPRTHPLALSPSGRYLLSLDWGAVHTGPRAWLNILTGEPAYDPVLQIWDTGVDVPPDAP